MQNKRLNLYILDISYVEYLSNVDNRVMSTSPHDHKENRPFVAIVIIMNDKKYCIPLTSPKPKHERMKNDVDFHKLYDKRQHYIGALNLNNMIPVSEEHLMLINIKPSKNDNYQQRRYKELLNNQLDWCNKNISKISKKANKLYRMVTETPEKYSRLVSRCCDFKKLEEALSKLLEQQEANTYTINKSYVNDDEPLDLTESEGLSR